MKLNAAIIILAGRRELFKKTLRYFYNNWNNKFNYPVFVHCLRDVFSNEEILNLKKKYKNLSFERVYPEVPKHINEEELFYNRIYNDYAYNNFSKGRLGYLHVCYFTSNGSSFGKKGCLNKKLEKFDYIMRLDDDVWFKKKINFDFFKKAKNYHMATGKLSITKSRKIHLTREKLFFYIKNFVNKNNISIKNNLLKKIIKTNNEINLFKLPYSLGNFEIYNMKTFKSKKFKKFILGINRFGGQYKYRWADYDITNLFLYIYYKKPILDLNISEKLLKSSHPDAKRIIDETNFFQKIINYIHKRLKRFLFKLKKNYI